MLVASLSVAPTSARADHDINVPFVGTRPIDVEGYAGFSWFGTGFVLGGRADIPIVPNGFVPTLDNAVYVGFGLELYVMDDAAPMNRAYGAGFGVPVCLKWEFFFDRYWSAFVELGVRVVFHPALFNRGDFYAEPAAWVVGQVGGSLHLSETFAITLRLGNPFVALGVTFSI
ncbi:MAG: hypothetical protein OHK0013_17860 [Sandaracinaceae bacterium]